MSGALVFSIITWLLVGLIAFVLVVNYKAIWAFSLACRAEMKKVAWPSKERVFLQTRVVLVSLVVTSLFFGGIDLGLTALMSFIFE